MLELIYGANNFDLLLKNVIVMVFIHLQLIEIHKFPC